MRRSGCSTLSIMFDSVLQWINKMRVEHNIHPKTVLEVGSFDNKGSSARPCFEGLEYIGVDIKEGDNVDIQMSVYDICNIFEAGYFDTVLCLHLLEHLQRPWDAIDRVSDVLRDGGHLFISMPTFGFPRHNYPSDYWRATREAITDVLMADYTILDIEDDRSVFSKHPFINCLGVK